jgi:hypothetical protein
MSTRIPGGVDGVDAGIDKSGTRRDRGALQEGRRGNQRFFGKGAYLGLKCSAQAYHVCVRSPGHQQSDCPSVQALLCSRLPAG